MHALNLLMGGQVWQSNFGFCIFWQPPRQYLAVNWIVYCFQLSCSGRWTQTAICQRWGPYCWSSILTRPRTGALCALQHLHQATCLMTIGIKPVSSAAKVSFVATTSQLRWQLSAWRLTRLLPTPLQSAKCNQCMMCTTHYFIAIIITFSAQMCWAAWCGLGWITSCTQSASPQT